MSIKNEFNSNNSSISTSLPKQSAINSEVYSNIDNLEQVQQGYQTVISNLTSRTEQNTNQLSGVNQEIQKTTNLVSVHGRTINDHDLKLKELDEKVKNFNTESLEGLSRHFKMQYDEMSIESKIWLKRLMETFGVGAMGWGLFFEIVLTSIPLVLEKYKFLYLLVPYNVIYISLLYFIASQYSHYKRLALDAKNRQVVAESYLGILNNSNDSTEKNIITKIVADTLFSRSVAESGAELPLKEIVRIGEKVLERR